MTTASLIKKRFQGPMQAMGGFFKMCVLTGKALAQPFEWKEFIQYSWFLMTVALLPTFAMSIPLTVLIIFIFNLLLQEFGAADVSGAGAALASVTQLGPLVTVLVVAEMIVWGTSVLAQEAIHVPRSVTSVMGWLARSLRGRLANPALSPPTPLKSRTCVPVGAGQGLCKVAVS